MCYPIGASSVVAWHLGGGGGGDGYDNNSTSSKSDIRGHITKVGCNRMTVSGGNKARVYMANNTSTDATTE